jgi:MFS transporter, ACS family, glucarate transporter
MAGARDIAEEFGPPPAGRGRVGVRHGVLAFAVALAALTYLDRVCISHAGVTAAIKRELGLSDVQMSYVYSAFTLAYALFEIPTGAWGDRIGTRRVLTRIVVWWSSFTMLTAAAVSYGWLLLIRFLFGAGEAGAFPNVARTFSRWFPVAERGTAQGVFFAGAHLGGGLTPLLVTALLGILPWRAVFVAFGAIGFVWALAWSVWFRDEPADHAAVSQKELKFIESGRTPAASHRLDAAVLRRILTDRSLVALCLMYFTQAYGFYFNITWLPTYLARRGLTAQHYGVWAGVLAGLPLILSAGADLLGGLTTDRLTRAYGLRIGRCGVGFASLLVAGIALIAGATAEDAIASALLIALAGAADSFLLGSCWGVCQDIGGPHAGLVAGCMNTAGQVGAVLSPLLLPRFQDPAIPLCIAGGLYLAGALCWWFVNPHRPILATTGEDEAGGVRSPLVPGEG